MRKTVARSVVRDEEADVAGVELVPDLVEMEAGCG